MLIVAIDPGTTQSGLCVLDKGRVQEAAAEVGNIELLQRIERVRWGFDTLVLLEEVENYGKNVGRDVFETVFWTGRFYQAGMESAATSERLKRRDVKLHLCGSMRAKDPDVRLALVDRFGGEKAAKGTKKAPGPLYGVSGHAWSALALAITYRDMKEGK